MVGGAAAFFSEIGLGIGVRIVGLLSSTMAELQAVVLVLKCVSSSCLVEMCLDSQAALDTCVSELELSGPDFCNCCWMERRHIVKGHSGVLGNVCADALACTSVYSSLLLPTNIHEHFLMANSMPIFGNVQYFVWDIFRSMNHVCWKVGSGSKILSGFLVCDVDWIRTITIWHPDLGMLSGSTSRHSAGLHSYFMKAVYGRLPVAVRKRLYDKNYFGVLCLHCREVESLASSHLPASFVVSEFFLSFVSDIGLYALFYKGFVLVGWFKKAVSRFRADMKRNSLVGNLGVVPLVHCGLERDLSDSMVKLIGIDDSFKVSFGFYKSWLFFSGLVNMVSVHISV
ncbi:hypothetical protein G9A89_011300 [Geosiphon pyriformis]|nr:hypothetical protein G9A89_011300 [Geosiphon pyriformis]